MLWHYWRRDVRDVEDQREQLYPKNHDKHLLITAPFITRLSRELATLYVQDPARDFNGPQMTEQTKDRIQRIYEGADVNGVMRSAQECMVALNQSTIWVLPVPQVGGVRLVLVPPHEQWVIMKDPTSHDERDVEAWYLRIPVKQDPSTGAMHYATAMVTDKEAVYVSGNSSVMGTGLFAEDVSNPLGFIPAVRLKGAQPSLGEFWCPCPEDLVAAQRSLSNALMDQHHLARMQGHGVPVLKGLPIAAASQIEIGPEVIVGLSDPDSSFEYAQADPRLGDYKDITEYLMQTVIAMNGLNPASVLKSSAISALAKRLETVDRQTERLRAASECKRVEQRLYKIIRAWVNHQRGVEVLPEARVAIEYREPAFVVDALHEQQAVNLRIEKGLSTSATELARLEGLSHEEARQRVIANRQEQLDIEASSGRASKLPAADIAAALQVVQAFQAGNITAGSAQALLIEGLGLSLDAAVMMTEGDAPVPRAYEIDGYFPLYRNEEQARAASPIDGSHEHKLRGGVHHMPAGLTLGVDMFHGTYQGPS